MEGAEFRMPGTIRVSRKTGEITGIDWLYLDAVTVAEWGRRLCRALDAVTDRPADPGTREGGENNVTISDPAGPR